MRRGVEREEMGREEVRERDREQTSKKVGACWVLINFTINYNVSILDFFYFCIPRIQRCAHEECKRAFISHSNLRRHQKSHKGQWVRDGGGISTYGMVLLLQEYKLVLGQPLWLVLRLMGRACSIVHRGGLYHVAPPSSVGTL